MGTSEGGITINAHLQSVEACLRLILLQYFRARGRSTAIYIYKDAKIIDNICKLSFASSNIVIRIVLSINCELSKQNKLITCTAFTTFFIKDQSLHNYWNNYNDSMGKYHLENHKRPLFIHSLINLQFPYCWQYKYEYSQKAN